MNIKIEKTNEKTLFKLDGWLDTASAPELDEKISEIENTEAIILDFEKVDYISSSGLRVVVACHRKAKDISASLSIINVCTEVMNIFKLTGLDKKLDITAKN